MANLRDWAELLHAVAWPSVAVFALILFRRSIDRSVYDILTRIPWERTTSFKARGIGEFKMTRKKEEILVASTKIPPGEFREKPIVKSDEPEEKHD